MKKKYPNFDSRELSIDDILAWELWPCFIKIHGKNITNSKTNYMYSKCCTMNILLSIATKPELYMYSFPYVLRIRLV